jgi:hypothetical protein
MSLLRRDAPPPPESWDDLREWSCQSWYTRFRAATMVMLPFSTLIMVVAAGVLLYAEPSWRTARLIVMLWVTAVFLTGLGYKRRMDRAAAQVPPITPASQNPTTAVDIRGRRDDY